MGPERKSMVISEKERHITAIHEAGHTLVAHLLPGTDPVHRVTIIPRGPALGVTQQLPTEDRLNATNVWAASKIAVLMGGRVAEELVFSHLTTGAGSDLEHATDLARKMVCNWGMSEKLGPLTFGRKEEHVFLGREIGPVSYTHLEAPLARRALSSQSAASFSSPRLRSRSAHSSIASPSLG